MTPLRSRPLGRDADAAVDTDGVAFDIRRETWGYPITQVKVSVSAAAYVGFGTSSTVPAAAETNTVHQAADTEEVYTFDGNQSAEGYVYVYAVASTIAVDISVFG